MLLGEEHDRGSFTCGVESLDRYLKTQAGQDVHRKANAVFILSEIGEPTQVLGYYTLCAMAISQGDVPETARKHVPRYPLVSATLIGQLAVAQDRQGQRLGAVLLADALQRAFESASTVGSSMVIVDALDEAAAGFYAAHGFVRLPDSLRLVLPIIRHHHEHSDGSGYPDGLRQNEIPLLPRILQVVDIYDALRTERPYKPALGHEQAAATMRHEARSGLWDKELVSEFFGMLDTRSRVA